VTATVSIAVADPANPTNTPPFALDDSFTTFSDPATPATLTGAVLGNDSDPDGDVLEVSTAGGVAPGAPFTTANGGTVVINTDGTFDYTPAAGFIGDDTFDYSVIDPAGNTDDATVTIIVYPDPDPAANDNPDANDDVATTQMNTPVSGNALANDSDLNADAIVAVSIDGVAVPLVGSASVATPNGGVLELNANGDYQYVPPSDFVGTETVQYTISDDNGGIDTATIYLSVFDVPPQPEDDINNTSVNVPVSGNVLVNDSSEPGDDLVIGDGSGNPITGPTALTTTQGGQILINPDGTYTYTPANNFVGEDSITLEVCDENGNCVNSELTIDVVDTTANTLRW